MGKVLSTVTSSIRSVGNHLKGTKNNHVGAKYLNVLEGIS